MVGRLATIAILLAATAAHADNAKLELAQKAIDGVRYNEAQPLLVAALQAGGNTPAEVVEIYRLSASTAIVLGQQDVAEQYYRRWLALAPNASLPDTVAPKVRAPFVAAQAYMAAHGRLAAKASIKLPNVDVIVESDPLAMVAKIAVGDEKKSVGADHAAHFEVETPPVIKSGWAIPIALLDEFGNHLVDLAESEITRDGATANVDVNGNGRAGGGGGDGSAKIDEPPPLPLYRETLVWTVASTIFLGAGVYLAFQARSENETLNDIAAHPSLHFFTEYSDAKARRDRDATAASVTLGIGGACAIVAVIMLATRPLARATVIAAPTSDGAAVSMSLRW